MNSIHKYSIIVNYASIPTEPACQTNLSFLKDNVCVYGEKSDSIILELILNNVQTKSINDCCRRHQFLIRLKIQSYVRSRSKT